MTDAVCPALPAAELTVGATRSAAITASAAIAPVIPEAVTRNPTPQTPCRYRQRTNVLASLSAASACPPFAPERQTGCPRHGPRSAPGLERLPDDVIQSVRLEEGRQAVGAWFAVGSQELVDEVRAVPASPRAGHERCDVPLDRPGAYVLEVCPDQSAVRAQQISHRGVAMERLSGQRALEDLWRQRVEVEAQRVDVALGQGGRWAQVGEQALEPVPNLAQRGQITPEVGERRVERPQRTTELAWLRRWRLRVVRDELPQRHPE